MINLTAKFEEVALDLGSNWVGWFSTFFEELYLGNGVRLR